MVKNLNNLLIVRSVTCFIFPYIILYALYIQINGEASPGGGFQAGVIFASAIIAAHLVLPQNIAIYFPTTLLVVVGVIGLMIYASVGCVALFFAENYLNYNVLLTDKLHAQALGIFIIELGVGLTVSSMMCLIYFILQKAVTS